MWTFKASYYDGKQSGAIEVALDVLEDGRVHSDPELPVQHISQLKIRPRIGNGQRYIELPGGALLESRDNDCLDLLERRWHSEHRGLAHRLEHNLPIVVLALIIVIGSGWGFVRYGLPAISEQIAQWMPRQVDVALSRESLKQLDEYLFEESELSEQQQASLREQFESLLPNEEERADYRLLFRNAPSVGANAFALPDGTVVVTDQLVELAGHNELLSGILLHEIGHVEHRHSMRMLVHRGGIAALIVMITGDISSASSLVVLLPTILLETNYSRELEYESDSYALEQMLSRDLDIDRFADIMERLMLGKAAACDAPEDFVADNQNESPQNDQETSNKEEDTAWFDYFATHPASEARIERFRKAAEDQRKGEAK